MEYPAFVDGARRCPPEDVGGPDGFMDFLEAVLDSAHEQHRDIVLYFASRFLDEFNDVQAVLVNCRFTGLSGRTITSVTPNRWTSSRPCHSEQVETSANVTPQQLQENVVEIVHQTAHAALRSIRFLHAFPNLGGRRAWQPERKQILISACDYE